MAEYLLFGLIGLNDRSWHIPDVQSDHFEILMAKQF